MEDEGATVVDRPGPLPRAVGEPVLQSRAGTPLPTTSTIVTAADAMRDEEIHRTRVFIRIGWAASVAGMAAFPLLDGVPSVTAAYAAALVLGMLVSFGYHQAFRDPQRYTSRAIFVLGVMTVINTHVAVLYYGTFTVAPLLLVIGMHFIGRSEIQARRAVLICAVVCYAVIASILIAGVIPDPGVLATDLPQTTSTLVIAALFVEATYAVAYLTGRHQRRISLNAIEQLQRATRVASQRAALLAEVRADLARAQHATAGRHTGDKIGEYELGMVLGRGAHGEVYDARHVTTGEPAAVKVLNLEHRADPTTLARFLREVHATSALDSPHIVRALATSEPEAAVPYLVMERLEGMTLADRLRRTPVMAPADVLRLVAHVSIAIDAASAAAVTHRDLKPQNLFVVGDTWKVLDFGVASLGTQGGTLTRGGLVGTPHYMAPEQARSGKVDARTDLYALGAIAYRALTGRNPFGGTDVPAILYAVVHTMPVAPSALVALGTDLDRWTALALAKDPAQRWPTGAAMATKLEAALRNELDAASRAAADRITSHTPWQRSE